MPSSLLLPAALRQQWKTLLPLLCLLLASCNTLDTAPNLSVQHSELLRLSERANRAQSDVLGGHSVSGTVYIFATPPEAVKEVRFHLDGKFLKRDRRAPFDLMGGTLRRAKPLRTRQLGDGNHTLTATFKHRDGRQTQVQSAFEVDNAPETAPAPVAPTPPPGSPTPETPTSSPARWQPNPGTSWQWQLQGSVDPTLKVDVYDIDLFDTSASTVQALQKSGKRVICYFSAGSFEPWRRDAAAFSAAVKGKKMDGWDELWLDIRNMSVLGPIMRARLDLAAQKSCDDVEPDNVDGYSNDSGFLLTSADQLVYNRFLATEAHVRGLAIGLKNDLEQVEALEPYFDFAVNEECFTYNECGLLTPFVKANKAVFGAEYGVSTQRFCAVTNALDFDFIKKRYSLDAYRETCR